MRSISLYSSRGQVLVLFAMALPLLLGCSVFAVDLVDLFWTRNWGYQAAQQAARIGTQLALESGPAGPDCLPAASLDPTRARAEAEVVLRAALSDRGLTPAVMQIEVLPDPAGGEIPAFPPVPVRLGEYTDCQASAPRAWRACEPAVGVYLALDVETIWLGPVFAPEGLQVHVFAASGVAQPLGACLEVGGGG